MSPEIPSTPAPTDVAELVRRLISSPWPTTETERRAWFAQNGLDMTEKATEGDFVVAEGPSVWGKSRGGWHFHDGEFVGLYWFLWAGESWATVVAPAATQLQDLFSGIAGSPVDVGEASGPATGFRASWTVDGYSIEMYAHGPDLGGDVPDERATAVQLHVDHASRSAREDAAARPASAAVQDRNG